MMRFLGISLILLGLVGVVFGGIQLDQKRADVDLAFLDFEVVERKTLPVPPAAGAAAILAGVAMMFVGGRRSEA